MKPDNPPLEATVSAEATILVVDDIPKNIQVVGSVLAASGYDVMVANSGAEALLRVEVQKPDLILLDLMMPEMNGVEVCQRLKSDERFAHIPVIFLTASTEAGHLQECFDSGAVDYVTKPFNSAELKARVRTHLELKFANDQLREFSARLQGLNNEKNEFMSIAAHDLRSPLSNIYSSAKIILSEPEMSRTEVEEFLVMITSTSEHLMKLVQDLLDFNAIDQGRVKMDLLPCNLTEVAESIVGNYRAKAAAKQQNLRFEWSSREVMVLAEESRLIQCLDNLISNAVKYTPHGKNICVRVLDDPIAPRFEVQDEGPGLTDEDKLRLFGRFARLSAQPTGGEPSSGLGLSIVKKIIEAQKGRVGCESILGTGSTFYVTLLPAL
jgi:two-component system sensor histidine kinase/response regulator